jgi:hypothetical protein
MQLLIGLIPESILQGWCTILQANFQNWLLQHQKEENNVKTRRKK